MEAIACILGGVVLFVAFGAIYKVIAVVISMCVSAVKSLTNGV